MKRKESMVISFKNARMLFLRLAVSRLPDVIFHLYIYITPTTVRKIKWILSARMQSRRQGPFYWFSGKKIACFHLPLKKIQFAGIICLCLGRQRSVPLKSSCSSSSDFLCFLKCCHTQMEKPKVKDGVVTLNMVFLQEESDHLKNILIFILSFVTDRPEEL